MSYYWSVVYFGCSWCGTLEVSSYSFWSRPTLQLPIIRDWWVWQGILALLSVGWRDCIWKSQVVVHPHCLVCLGCTSITNIHFVGQIAQDDRSKVFETFCKGDKSLLNLNVSKVCWLFLVHRKVHEFCLWFFISGSDIHKSSLNVAKWLNSNCAPSTKSFPGRSLQVVISFLPVGWIWSKFFSVITTAAPKLP